MNQILNRPIIFVHIPKTGGTSFRRGLEIYFGKEKFFLDYGKDSPDTSIGINLSLYWNKVHDVSNVEKEMKSHGVACLAGHFPAIKYKPCFLERQFVTFVRDPVSRVFSNFAHARAHFDYGGSFEEFYTDVDVVDAQSRLMQPIKAVDWGFIGLTEQYKQSIDRFNALFGCNVPVLKENVGAPDRYKLTKKERADIESLNPLDMELFEAVRTIYGEKKQSSRMTFFWN